MKRSEMIRYAVVLVGALGAGAAQAETIHVPEQSVTIGFDDQPNGTVVTNQFLSFSDPTHDGQSHFVAGKVKRNPRPGRVLQQRPMLELDRQGNRVTRSRQHVIPGHQDQRIAGQEPDRDEKRAPHQHARHHNGQQAPHPPF